MPKKTKQAFDSNREWLSVGEAISHFIREDGVEFRASTLIAIARKHEALLEQNGVSFLDFDIIKKLVEERFYDFKYPKGYLSVEEILGKFKIITQKTVSIWIKENRIKYLKIPKGAKDIYVVEEKSFQEQYDYSKAHNKIRRRGKKRKLRMGGKYGKKNEEV